MPTPDTHPLTLRLLDRGGDHSAGLIPRTGFPAILAAFPCTPQRGHQPFRIVENLTCGVASYTEKATAIWIIWITFERKEFVAFHFDLHPALGGMTIHRTHGCDLAFL